MKPTISRVTAFFAVLLLATPVTAEAQPAGKLARVGWLWSEEAGPPTVHLEAFRDGLRTHGWVEGRNLVIEQRSFSPEPRVAREQRLARLAALAVELAALRVDLIVASPALAAVGAQRANLTIPVVFAAVSDPVRFGLVASLARPGGTMTGISYLGIELNPKRVQLLKEALPEITRVGVLVPGDHPFRARMVADVEAAARLVGVNLQLLDVSNADPNVKIDQAFETMTHGRAQAVLGLQGPHFYRERKRIAELSLRHRLPGIFELGDYAQAGCLLAYSPNLPDIFRYAATYVDKILKGAKPADLPVEQPTKFELVINAKTAKALGLQIPPSLLLRANQIIE